MAVAGHTSLIGLTQAAEASRGGHTFYTSQRQTYMVVNILSFLYLHIRLWRGLVISTPLQ